MDKMNVITFSETGHVLGVTTRSSLPDAAVSPEDVALNGLVMRRFDDLTGEVTEVRIPANSVGVTLVDYDTRVLYRPHLFVLEDGSPEQKSDAAPTPTLSLDGSQVAVTLPANVTSQVKVWCQIAGGTLTEPIVRSVTVDGSIVPTNTGSEPLDLGPAQYQVAVFAADYAATLFQESVP